MKSRTTRSFRKLFDELPERVKQQARQAYRLFQDNPSHPGLHFKQVHPEPPTYSARVGISYRAIGARMDDTMIWYWIGTHADYGRLLTQL